MKIRNLLLATVLTGATWVAPACADLSCHDLLRGVILGDPDVLTKSADLELPLVQATVQEIQNNGTDINGISMVVRMEVVNYCRALPDDTVGNIVATRIKAVDAAIEAAQSQRQTAKGEAEAEARPALTTHSPAGTPPYPNAVGLSAAQRGAIGDHARECWSTDPGMLDLDNMQVLLTVTTDANGVARMVIVAQQDQGRVAGDMRLRVFAERAVRAVLDPHCASLPLPQNMLGRTNVITFRFSP